MSNPGQIALGIVGGIIGAFVGGPAGAAYGLQLGLAVGSVVSPTQLPGSFGPRLTDNKSTTSQLGAPICEVWGTDAVAGTIIWLGDVVEHAHTEEVGGKGGPEGESTTYTYTQSIAIGLCRGPMSGILRIWENGKLLYDVRGQRPDESNNDYTARLDYSVNSYGAGFTLYLGDEDQLPDPTLELKEGLGNVPAYRGLMYIVFHDRLLRDDQGQRHPNFKFEVAATDAGSNYSLIALASAVGGAATGKHVMTSSDNATQWTMRTTPTGAWRVLAGSASLGKVIAVAGGGGAVMQSFDAGATWALIGAGVGDACRDVCWAPELDLFVAISATTIYTSPTGEVWTARAAPADRLYHAIVWMPHIERFAVSAVNIVTGLAAEVWSADAITWNSATAPRPRAAFTLASGAGGSAYDGAVAAFYGATVDDFFITADGDFYTEKTAPSGNIEPAAAHVSGASAAAGQFVLGWALDNTRQISSTVNGGLTWVGPLSGVQQRTVSEVVYSARQYVLLYANPNALTGPAILERAVATSPDGRTWTAQVTPAAADSAEWSDFTVVYSPPPEGTVSLATIVADICERCGLGNDDVDVSDLVARRIEGYQVSRVTDGRSAIAVLRQVGFFDSVESAGIAKFATRGKAPVRTLALTDLGAHASDSAAPPSVTTRTQQDLELPRQLFVQFRDPDRDYEQGQQPSPTRLITDAVNDSYVDVAVAIDASAAAKIAEVLWADQWAARWQHSIAVDASHTDLEPTDCILVPVDGRLERMRIVAAEDSAIVLRTLSLVRDDDGSYVSAAIAEPPAVVPSGLRLYATSTLTLLDLPALRVEDNDAGVYAAVVRSGSGTSWGGAGLYRGEEGGPLSALASVTSEALIGSLASALPAGPSTVWDRGNTLVVELTRGQFESRTEAEVLGGANTLAIGAHGRWELVSFVTATQISGTQWRLTQLLRGRRGTEHAIGSSLAGDTAVLVSGAGIVRLPVTPAELGVPFVYRAVTLGAALGTGTDQSFTAAGEALVPFSPVHAAATQGSGGDLTISWVRRDRLLLDYVVGVATPMSEASEAYAVDILDGNSPSAVLRTLTNTTPVVLYTLAQQSTDFGSPVPTEITVRIYQLGALGRGHVCEESV